MLCDHIVCEDALGMEWVYSNLNGIFIARIWNVLLLCLCHKVVKIQATNTRVSIVELIVNGL